MAKILDLNALVEEPGVVILGDKEHKIPEPSFGQFAKLIKVQQEAEEDGDELKALEAAKDLIQTLVPTLTDENIDSLTMAQLKALIDFIVADVHGEDEVKN